MFGSEIRLSDFVVRTRWVGCSGLDPGLGLTLGSGMFGLWSLSAVETGVPRVFIIDGGLSINQQLIYSHFNEVPS